MELGAQSVEFRCFQILLRIFQSLNSSTFAKYEKKHDKENKKKIKKKMKSYSKRIPQKENSEHFFAAKSPKSLRPSIFSDFCQIVLFTKIRVFEPYLLFFVQLWTCPGSTFFEQFSVEIKGRKADSQLP